jgi:hypothetical protein
MLFSHLVISWQPFGLGMKSLQTPDSPTWIKPPSCLRRMSSVLSHVRPPALHCCSRTALLTIYLSHGQQLPQMDLSLLPPCGVRRRSTSSPHGGKSLNRVGMPLIKRGGSHSITMMKLRPTLIDSSSSGLQPTSGISITIGKAIFLLVGLNFLSPTLISYTNFFTRTTSLIGIFLLVLVRPSWPTPFNKCN